MTVSLLFVFLVVSSICQAGVKDFDNKISVALVSVNHSYTLGLQSNLNNVDTTVNWRANTASLSGTEISYKGLTLAYLTSNGLTKQNIDLRGHTSYEDIRGGLFFGPKKNWVFLGYYNRYKGFYLDNTLEVDPTANLYIQQSHLETFNSGAALMYVFNPDSFSAAAAYVQSAQQTSSGGSWLLLTSFDVNYIKDDEDIIPKVVENDFGNQMNFREGKFATTSLSIGYAYTFVWKKVFANLTFILGRGIQQKSYTYDSLTENKTQNTDKSALGYSLGYNGDSVYFGMSYVQDNNSFDVGTVRVRPLLNSSRIFLGIRF